MDGIDAVLVTITEENGHISHLELKGSSSIAYTPELKKLLLHLCTPGSVDIDALTRAHYGLGEWNAQAVLTLLKETNTNAEDVAVIGLHGQTIWHAPNKEPFPGITHPFDVNGTLQITNAQVVALRTGIPVISDFRAADLALGGQGAPLAQIIDYYAFRENGKTVAVQNIGGIGNVTLLPKEGELLAFDTGPGNMIIDGLVQHVTGEPYDNGGMIAQKGTVNQALLNQLMSDPYFAQEPPKSTGREVYGTHFVQTLLKEDLSFEDLVATATAFTATSIIDSYSRFIIPKYGLDRVIVAGGGAKNKTLLTHLKANLNCPVERSESYSIPDQSREAMAFALLAHESLAKRPSNFPHTTGASRPTILGTMTLQERIE